MQPVPQHDHAHGGGSPLLPTSPSSARRAFRSDVEGLWGHRVPASHATRVRRSGLPSHPLMPSRELCRAGAEIAGGCWGWWLNPRHNPGWSNLSNPPPGVEAPARPPKGQSGDPVVCRTPASTCGKAAHGSTDEIATSGAMSAFVTALLPSPRTRLVCSGKMPASPATRASCRLRRSLRRHLGRDGVSHDPAELQAQPWQNQQSRLKLPDGCNAAFAEAGRPWRSAAFA